MSQRQGPSAAALSFCVVYYTRLMLWCPRLVSWRWASGQTSWLFLEDSIDQMLYILPFVVLSSKHSSFCPKCHFSSINLQNIKISPKFAKNMREKPKISIGNSTQNMTIYVFITCFKISISRQRRGMYSFFLSRFFPKEIFI